MAAKVDIAGQLRQFVLTKFHDNQCTPDGVKLDRLSRQLIFVYGTLKRGFPRNPWMEQYGGAKYICSGYTARSSFIMYNKSSGKKFPILFKSLVNEPGAKVYGELWSVPTTFVRYLDDVECNNSLYNRTRIPFSCHTSAGSVLAWAYLGNRDYWKTDIAKGHIRRCAITVNPFRHFNYSTQDLSDSVPF